MSGCNLVIYTLISAISFYLFLLNRARYWRLIYGISQAIEAIKNPCQCRGFERDSCIRQGEG